MSFLLLLVVLGFVYHFLDTFYFENLMQVLFLFVLGVFALAFFLS